MEEGGGHERAGGWLDEQKGSIMACMYANAIMSPLLCMLIK